MSEQLKETLERLKKVFEDHQFTGAWVANLLILAETNQFPQDRITLLQKTWNLIGLLLRKAPPRPRKQLVTELRELFNQAGYLAEGWIENIELNTDSAAFVKALWYNLGKVLQVLKTTPEATTEATAEATLEAVKPLSLEEIGELMQQMLNGSPALPGYVIAENTREGYTVHMVVTAPQDHERTVHVGVESPHDGRVHVTLYTSDEPATINGLNISAGSLRLITVSTKHKPTRMQITFTPTQLGKPIIVIKDVPAITAAETEPEVKDAVVEVTPESSPEYDAESFAALNLAMRIELTTQVLNRDEGAKLPPFWQLNRLRDTRYNLVAAGFSQIFVGEFALIAGYVKPGMGHKVRLWTGGRYDKTTKMTVIPDEKTGFWTFTSKLDQLGQTTLFAEAVDTQNAESIAVEIVYTALEAALEAAS